MFEGTRSSALTAIAKPGRYGADKGTPGVVLTVLPPGPLATVIARKGKAKALQAALAKLKGAEARWAGPSQHFVSGLDFETLRRKLDGLASCADQSHARVAFRISGAQARNVLAKGTPVDLHAAAFAIGTSALTQMAHVGVHLTRTGEDAFELSVFRGFAESFWGWLTLMSEEHGYQVA